MLGSLFPGGEQSRMLKRTSILFATQVFKLYAGKVFGPEAGETFKGLLSSYHKN